MRKAAELHSACSASVRQVNELGFVVLRIPLHVGSTMDIPVRQRSVNAPGTDDCITDSKQDLHISLTCGAHPGSNALDGQTGQVSPLFQQCRVGLIISRAETSDQFNLN